MIIETGRINEDGMQLKDTTELSENLLIEDGSFFLDRVDYDILFIKKGKQIKAKGKVKTAVSIRCIRCLEDFELKINSDFDIILFPLNLIDMTNNALNTDDMEYIFYEGDKIDLEKILIEQVNLFIPYKPICKPSCRGICPNCGTNLNQQECRCDNSNDDINIVLNKIKR